MWAAIFYQSFTQFPVSSGVPVGVWLDSPPSSAVTISLVILESSFSDVSAISTLALPFSGTSPSENGAPLSGTAQSRNCVEGGNLIGFNTLIVRVRPCRNELAKIVGAPFVSVNNPT